MIENINAMKCAPNSEKLHFCPPPRQTARHAIARVAWGLFNNVSHVRTATRKSVHERARLHKLAKNERRWEQTAVHSLSCCNSHVKRRDRNEPITAKHLWRFRPIAWDSQSRYKMAATPNFRSCLSLETAYFSMKVTTLINILKANYISDIQSTSVKLQPLRYILSIFKLFFTRSYKFCFSLSQRR